MTFADTGVGFGLLLTGDTADVTIARAELAEELGFDTVYVGHHRFTPGFGYTIHPWILLAAIAARTERIRLATSIFLLPLSHPLDVAEEVASLDVLSGGRVILGPGLGYRPYEYEAMELPYHRRGRLMSECLEVVRGVWEHESFSYDGEFFHFTDVTLTPRPVQRPSIPIWVGANLDAGVDRAARLGDGWVVGFNERLPKLVGRLERYRSMAVEHGRSANVSLMRLVGMGATRDEVEAEWLPAVYDMLRSYAKVEAPTDRGDATERSLKAARRGDIALADLGNDMFVAGTPDDVIAGIRRSIDETHCDEVLVYTGAMPSEEFLRLFAAEVMPVFR
jgi:probable F420-dependent oxidoreductase